MEKAAFTLKTFVFDKVRIDLSNHKSRDMKIDFNPKGIFDEVNSLFELVFEVKIYNEGQKESPFVEISCVSQFKFEDVRTIKDIPNFFYKNSIAILFPFVRAYITTVTTHANVPGIILPVMNLTHLEEPLRNNTSKK